MKKRLFLLSLLLVFSLVNLVSAEVLISQPNSVYNLNDVLKFQVTIQPKHSSNGFALVSVMCGDSQVDVYKNALTVAAGESKALDISLPLTPAIIGTSSGNCFIRTTYAGESSDSALFTITNHIDVQVTFNAPQYSPNDILQISGKAVRDDGTLVEGFMHVTLGNLTVTVPVKQGVIAANISVPSYIAPGDVSFKAEVYEKDEDNSITNIGSVERTVRIKQIVKNIVISLDALEVTPDAAFTYKLSALDQVGAVSEKDIALVVSKPDGSQFLSKLVRSDIAQEITFPLNASWGVWTITASLDGLLESKTFSMPEIQRASFTIVNDTLIVQNIGNVPYTKSVEVTIGDKTIVKPVSLELDGSKVFKLLAPTSKYSVQITDGLIQTSAFSVPLTGRAIDLGEVKNFSPAIIPALFIVLVLVALFLVVKFRKAKGFRNAPRSYSEYQQRPGLVKAVVSNDASVEEGSRETAAIIALRLPMTASNASHEMLSALKQKASARRAHAEVRGNFMLFLLTARLSGESYGLEAVKLAQEIHHSIKSAAASGNLQAPCSIGITKGEVITSGSLGRLFSFTALGNAVSKAQKLASQANGDILITDTIRTGVGSQVRASRVPGVDAWKVENVVNRDEYSGFVDGFVKRYNKK